jgi:hypothetical protein
MVPLRRAGRGLDLFASAGSDAAPVRAGGAPSCSHPFLLRPRCAGVLLGGWTTGTWALLAALSAALLADAAIGLATMLGSPARASAGEAVVMARASAVHIRLFYAAGDCCWCRDHLSWHGC